MEEEVENTGKVGVKAGPNADPNADPKAGPNADPKWSGEAEIDKKVDELSPGKNWRQWDTWVINCRDKEQRAQMGVYVGRRHPMIGKEVPGAGGEWGNPFHIGRDGGRSDAIQKFRAAVERSPQLQEKIKAKLRGKILGCWCSPNACHAHILAEFANKEGDKAPQDKQGPVIVDSFS